MSFEEESDTLFWSGAARFDSEPKEALSLFTRALDINPRHAMALVEIGELYLFRYEHFEMEEEESNEIALGYFDRALLWHPDYSDAWGGKALVLFYMERYSESLSCAEQGIKSLSVNSGYGTSSIEVHINVAEMLFSVMIRCYLSLGEQEKATKALREGLSYCEVSVFLEKYIYLLEGEP